MKREMRIFILMSLPATYVFCCFHPWPTGNALVFVILSFYMKLKTLTETDNTFAECGYSWLDFSLDPHSGHTLLLRSRLQAVCMSYYMGLVCTSMLTLMSITFDQLIAATSATRALHQTKQMTWGKLISVLTWVISQAFAAPHFVFWELLILIRQYVRKNTQTVTQNWFLKWSKWLLLIFASRDHLLLTNYYLAVC